MSKLCILGEDVEPCFEGASITNVQFSFEDDFKQKMYALMETMQEILSNKGGTPVFNTYAVEIGSHLWDAIYDYIWEQCHDRHCDMDMYIDGIYEEGTQKFAILRNRKDLTYYRLNFTVTEDNGFVPDAELVKVSPDWTPAENPQFAMEDIEAYEAQYKKNKEPKDEDKEEKESEGDKEPAVTAESEPAEDEDEEKKKKKADKYNLEEVVEYQELLNKYNALETTNQQLQETISTLTAEKQELVNFKNQVEKDKKEDLINNTFYMLSDEQKKDCIDNINTYSYDEIEAKLSVICVRNKVSFSVENEPKTEEQTTIYNLNDIQTEDSDLPDWIKRVNEVRKEKNL